MLVDLISPTQASFVPKRHTADNIFMVQEVVHYLRRTSNKEGGMIYKIDIEKAYDKVNWLFLKNVMIDGDEFPS